MADRQIITPQRSEVSSQVGSWEALARPAEDARQLLLTAISLLLGEKERAWWDLGVCFGPSAAFPFPFRDCLQCFRQSHP